MTIVELEPLSPFVDKDLRPSSVMEAESNEEVFRNFGEHWIPDYSLYRRPDEGLGVMRQKFVDLAKALKDEEELGLAEGQIEEDLATSLATVDRFYEEWTSTEKLGNGSFAFMVPTRAERENGFAPEYRPFYPIINHIGPRLGQLMLVGTPPFVVDQYHKGIDGKDEQGVMLFAPIFGDMLRDIENPEDLERTFNNAITDAVTFARDRLGVSSVGLGAILPAVTDFGRTIDVEGVRTTTGHGGTIHLINEAIEQASQQGILEDKISKIGVIGLGSIGASVASVMAAEYPKAHLVLCDTNPQKIKRTVDALSLPESKYNATESALAVMAMQDCEVVVCATTTPISIPDKLVEKSGNKPRRLIIDDSQPTAVNPVEAGDNAAAHVVWPIGHSNDTRLHRTNFDYGDLGPIDKGVWGCEAEAFCAWERPELALRKPVDPEAARAISQAAKEMGIGAAALQCYGKYIQ